MLDRYAQLLVKYSLDVQPGWRVLLRSSTVAEPLIAEIYKALLQAGAHVEVQLSMADQDHLFYTYANEDQLSHLPTLYQTAIDEFDAIVSIMASYNLKSNAGAEKEKRKIVDAAIAPVKKRMMQRSANKELHWVLAQYPCHASAQEAGMSLREFQDFIFGACMLDQDDPSAAWSKLSEIQESLVQRLNTVKSIQFIGPQTNLTASVDGRIWINSDGRRNMPSGEVFTAPVEDAINGEIFFDVPTVFQSSNVQGIHLRVENGVIQSWSAKEGQDVLDYVFNTPGARQFGELAIGTNYAIQEPIKNILFDEKIGGSIHMAVGASYPECGGKNESSIHWDMIKYMHEGQILADGELIYENGAFIWPEAAALKKD